MVFNIYVNVSGWVDSLLKDINLLLGFGLVYKKCRFVALKLAKGFC